MITRADRVRRLFIGIDAWAQGVVAQAPDAHWPFRLIVIEALADVITTVASMHRRDINALLAADEARIVLELPTDALERLAKLRRLSRAKTSVEVIVAALAAYEAELTKKKRRA